MATHRPAGHLLGRKPFFFSTGLQGCRVLQATSNLKALVIERFVLLGMAGIEGGFGQQQQWIFGFLAELLFDQGSERPAGAKPTDLELSLGQQISRLGRSPQCRTDCES